MKFYQNWSLISNHSFDQDIFPEKKETIQKIPIHNKDDTLTVCNRYHCYRHPLY